VRFLNKLLLVTASIFLLTECGTGDNYKHITHDKAKEIIASQKATIVDVRSREEYDKAHVAGAILVPIEEIRRGNVGSLTDKGQTLLLYCWTGRRAEEAAVLLSKMGYKHIYEFGGIIDWTGPMEGNELPIIAPHTQP